MHMEQKQAVDGIHTGFSLHIVPGLGSLGYKPSAEFKFHPPDHL